MAYAFQFDLLRCLVVGFPAAFFWGADPHIPLIVILEKSYQYSQRKIPPRRTGEIPWCRISYVLHFLEVNGSF